MEDVLTSEVFGPLRYVHAEAGFRPFLSRALSLAGTPCLANATGKLTLRDVSFWPTWSEPGCLRCEPDLFIVLTDEAGDLHAIAVEAKYWSGKSNRGAGVAGVLHDQLAIQWQNLLNISSRINAKPALVYLTTHMSMPREDIEASEQDWDEFRGLRPPMSLHWLSWRNLWSLFSQSEHLALRDISMCADRLNLTWFRGLSHLPDCPPIKWKFANFTKQGSFQWAVAESNTTVNWSFRR